MGKISEKIGFIGAGNMAYAICSGLINQGVIDNTNAIASIPNLNRLSNEWKELDIKFTTSNYEVTREAGIIFICIKPYMLEKIADDIKSNYNSSVDFSNKLFISILAGVNMNRLETAFNFIEKVKIVRTMPNTPMQVAEGCSLYCPGAYADEKDVQIIDLLLNSIGSAHKMEEKLIDAATGISGCGPAFIYIIIEALADGGVLNGVPRKMALELAAQTVLGAAKTVKETGRHPGALKDDVCSPGGSTIVGVHELEKAGIRNAIINAVNKAYLKSSEMGIKK